MADFSLIGNAGKTETFFTDLSNSRGTNVALPASANVKSSWVEIKASTAFDYEALNIYTRSFSGSQLFDIGVGASGFEEVVAENILFGMVGGNASLTQSSAAQVALNIKAGSRIAFRAQSSVINSNIRISFTGIGGSFSSSLGTQKLVSYGATTADSGGVSVDPGATINTKGSYSEIVASTGEDVKGFYIVFGDRNLVKVDAGFLFDIAVGAGGSEEIILANYSFVTSTTEIGAPWISSLIPMQIPAGTRIAVRAQSETNNATSRTYDVTILGAV